MKEITIDGCDYEYEISDFTDIFGNGSIIDIYDVNNRQVADVDINNNLESISVKWFDCNGNIEGSYPYYEYRGDVADLVRWVVSTSPWI